MRESSESVRSCDDSYRYPLLHWFPLLRTRGDERFPEVFCLANPSCEQSRAPDQEGVQRFPSVRQADELDGTCTACLKILLWFIVYQCMAVSLLNGKFGMPAGHVFAY